MATSMSVPCVHAVNPLAGALRLVPGVALLTAIGYAGKALERTVNAYAKVHHRDVS
jgi:hypothetical protein